MRTVSERWADAIGSSHQMLVEVSVDGEALPLTAGSVTLDNTSPTRGRADLSFADPNLIPEHSTDTLAPYDNEFTIKRGLAYSEDDSELVQLGLLRVEETVIEADGSGTDISVSLLDRAQKVSDAKFESATTVSAGSDYLTVIQNVIAEVIPNLQTNFISRTLSTPEVPAEEGGDRWDFVQNMAAAIGCELFFDNDGVLVLRLIPTISGEPVAHLVEGSEGVEVKPTLLSASKRWSRTDTYNRWTVAGDNPNESGAPPHAVALDDDPTSPTYYYGSFGRKPKDIYSSGWIIDDAQALDAANGMKAKERGTAQVVEFGALVNPALEPGDVVQVTRTRINPEDPDNPEARIVIADEKHIIDQLTIPLTAGESMSGITRALRVTT